jgi:N-acyl-D-aspartate/D-glutamate deacylase
MTSATADLYGLSDRGRIAPGAVGDLNVIDLERLQLRRPERIEDLPGGAGRLIQRADGYVATVKSGTVTVADGELTGEQPGRLLRGAR